MDGLHHWVIYRVNMGEMLVKMWNNTLSLYGNGFCVIGFTIENGDVTITEKSTKHIFSVRLKMLRIAPESALKSILGNRWNESHGLPFSHELLPRISSYPAGFVVRMHGFSRNRHV